MDKFEIKKKPAEYVEVANKAPEKVNMEQYYLQVLKAKIGKTCEECQLTTKLQKK